ncbi:uncharacterized protein LOC129776839 [Toxorhynchites rutilus septentrionalis]|uniref:uncharacterized protein LOC129776839 n=1 Tax=Toxorhynchites rutilus septentrionalis TaxID=329112 RepID=UPI00247A0D54|nr:uncharacterized protein LOC129776839 [Toxorhynchites rutilus septentrionalis]
MQEVNAGHSCILRYDSGTNLPPITPESSTWTKITRRLRKIALLSPDHPDAEIFFRSFAQMANENKRLVQDYPACIIHPLSAFRQYWDIVMFFILSAHMVLLSFVVSYLIYMDLEEFPWLIRTDLALCTILAIDFILKFFTGYIIKNTKRIVLEPRKILLNNLKYLRAVYNLIAFVPFILFLYKLNCCYYQSEPLFYLTFAILLYAINIFRFRDITRCFEVIPKMFKASEIKIMILKLIISTMYVIHWTSCIGDIIPLLAYSTSETPLPKWNETQYLIGNFLVDVYWDHFRKHGEQKYPMVVRQRSAMIRDDFMEFRKYYGTVNFSITESRDHRYVLMKLDDAFHDEPILVMYIRSVMDAIQVALQGRQVDSAGTNATNNTMTCALVLVGWLWLTYILLTMIRMVISTDLSETRYDEIINELNAYAFNKRLGAESKAKMQRHFANRFRMKYFDEEAIQDTISNNLRCSIRMETCHHLVNNVELFRNFPHALIEGIVDRLKLEHFLENDVIIEAGSFGDAMYFIASGTAAVYSVGGKELGHLVDGDHFGEISLLKKDQRRTANVVALEVCEIYKLSYADFHKLIEPHSNLLERMQKLADERLAKIQGAKNKVSEEDVYDNFLQ